MKKYLITLLLITAFTCVFSDSYYIDPVNGDDSTGIVNDSNYPFKTWSHLAPLTAPNKYYQKRGTTYYLTPGGYQNWITVQNQSTTLDNPLIIGAYGNASDPRPVISSIIAIPSGRNSSDWTQIAGTNIYYLSTATWNGINGSPTENPTRLWLDGVESQRAESASQSDLSKIDSTCRWFWNSSAHRLYVYSDGGNPASAYSKIEGLQAVNRVISLYNSQGVLLKDLDLRGAYIATIKVIACQNTIIQNCNIGQGGIRGVTVEGYSGIESTYITIYNNTIDSYYRFNHAYDIGLMDGIVLASGASHNMVYDNDIYDWGHSGIDIYCLTTGFTDGTSYNNVHHNVIDCANTGYCRGVSITGTPTYICENNSFTLNIITNTTVRNQINACNNSFTYNHVIGVTSSLRKNEIGQGLAIETFQTFSLTGNTVSNNRFQDCEGPGFSFIWSGLGGIHNNTISENTFQHCGIATGSLHEMQIEVQNNSNISNNTFTTNAFAYDSSDNSNTTLIMYKGMELTVPDFNSLNSILIQNNTRFTISDCKALIGALHLYDSLE